MRGCLLDELQKQYVVTARAKGVSERALLFKYPIRVAINPVVSTIGWTLPAIVSGETITAIVLSLPTIGPLLFQGMILGETALSFLGLGIRPPAVSWGALLADQCSYSRT